MVRLPVSEFAAIVIPFAPFSPVTRGLSPSGAPHQVSGIVMGSASGRSLLPLAFVILAVAVRELPSRSVTALAPAGPVAPDTLNSHSMTMVDVVVLAAVPLPMPFTPRTSKS